LSLACAVGREVWWSRKPDPEKFLAVIFYLTLVGLQVINFLEQWSQ